MFRLGNPPQRVIEYPVSGSYELRFTPDEAYFDYKAQISLNHRYEVLGGSVIHIEAYDRDGGELDTDQLLKDYPYIKDNIIEEATAKALEKVQSIDFEREADND